MTQRGSSIKEVARLAGVSVGTVSNVMNRPEIVAEPTRRRVEEAVERLGYVLNGSARNLRTGRSTFIGLVVLDVTNPFFTEVARGVEDAANDAGYTVVLCNSDDSIDKERRYLRGLEEQRVRGLVITPVNRDPEHLLRLRRRGMGVVLLDRPSAEPDLCSVAVDDVRGGELAASHLLDLGHRRLGFVTGPRSIQQCAERRAGLRAAVEARGLDPEEVVVEIGMPALNAAAGEAALERLLAGQAPTGVFCANDLLALGVMRGSADRGVSIPEDLALVGYDDVEFASVLRTPLTTVRQPKYELGSSAMRLLSEQLDEDDRQPQQLLFDPELIVRASTGPPSP